MIVARREAWTGRTLLLVLMVVTIVPFLSLFTTALHPSNSVPPGLEWPSDPQWGNFLEAFDEASMGALLISSVLIVLGVVPVVGGHRDDGRFRHRASADPWLAVPLPPVPPRADAAASRASSSRSTTSCARLGLLNTKLAIILPLIGLYMPFGVFWMRAHFVNMPCRAVGGRAGRRRDDARPLLADPCAARETRDRVAGDPAVGLDVEPVPARPGAGGGPDGAHDGGRSRRLPGSLRDQHPAALRRVTPHPDPDAHRLPDLPAPVHLGTASRLAEGLRVSVRRGPQLLTYPDSLGGDLAVDPGVARRPTVRSVRRDSRPAAVPVVGRPRLRPTDVPRDRSAVRDLGGHPRARRGPRRAPGPDGQPHLASERGVPGLRAARPTVRIRRPVHHARQGLARRSASRGRRRPHLPAQARGALLHHHGGRHRSARDGLDVLRYRRLVRAGRSRPSFSRRRGAWSPTGSGSSPRRVSGSSASMPSATSSRSRARAAS